MPLRFLVLILLALGIFAFACSPGDDDHTSTPGAAAAERSTEDRPDDVEGPQLHLIYALPSDGIDGHLDTDGTIARSFVASQNWLGRETGGRALRLDLVDGRPDVTFFQLSRDDTDLQAEGAFLREAIEGELKDSGFGSPDKIYAVYYDGGSTYACGSGAYPPTIEGDVLVLFLHGLPGGTSITCGDNDFAEDENSPVFWEFVVIHETLHTLGFVPDCAPHETMSGHISGPIDDLMYEGPEEVGATRSLDKDNDDYYKTDIAGCPDFDDSPYLAP